DLRQNDPALVVGRAGPIQQRLCVSELEAGGPLMIRNKKPRVLMFVTEPLKDFEFPPQRSSASQTGLTVPEIILEAVRPAGGQSISDRFIDVLPFRLDKRSPVEAGTFLDQIRLPDV